MITKILRSNCIIAGDSAVGKTAITEVFLSNGTNFPKNYNMTCGVKLDSKAVNIPDTSDIVELYLFDSSGKDVYVETMQKYWIAPSVICIVYEVTQETSLKNCEKWLRAIQSISGNSSLPGVLLGNKTDLVDRRAVAPKSGQEMAKTLGLQYFECSARDNQGVEEPFFYIANECHKLSLQ